MPSRVAVITDSVSGGFYFPLFLSHYRKELPNADIFVVTPAGRANIFSIFHLTDVIELSIDFYDDTVRANTISDLVSDLTKRYTHVLRVDCDEFVIADPRRFPSLQAYIDATPHDCVTAMGYDVIASTTDEPLDFSRPILGTQRRFAFALNALNKTCLTRVPLKWGRGFHACQRRPAFDGLFLMHLKRADIDIQFEFGQFLAELTREDEYIRNYYLTSREQIASFHENLFQRIPTTGWDAFVDQEFLAAFFAGLNGLSDTGLWDIAFEISQRLVEIPAEFHGRIGPVSETQRSAITETRAIQSAAPADIATGNLATGETAEGRQLHDTALEIGTKFLELYSPACAFTAVEIGSQDVNGTLRGGLPSRATYIGIDAEPGRNVDVIGSGHALPLPDAIADVTIASSVFEHDRMFWQIFLELCRITKLGGHIYVSAPSNGTVHRYPQDNWRFYPDAGLALVEWARTNGLSVVLVESFVADRQADVWNDFVAIFRRGDTSDLQQTSFLFSNFPSRNVRHLGSDQVINQRERVEDQELLAAAIETLLAIEAQLADVALDLKLAPQPEDHSRRLKALTPSSLSQESTCDKFSASFKFIDTAITAMKGEFSKIRSEAAVREKSLRRRLRKAEDALENVRNALPLDPSTEQVWFSIDRFEPTLIIGWAMLVVDQARRLKINIYSGEELIASATANAPRPHLLRWGYGDGQFGFGFDLRNIEGADRSNIRVEAQWDEGAMELGRLAPIEAENS